MDFTLNEITIGNRHSLALARNSKNEIVNAKDAKEGEQYTCPICNVRMELFARNGCEPVFRRWRNNPHTKICKALNSQESKRYTFLKKHPYKTINQLCSFTTPKKNRKVAPSKNTTAVKAVEPDSPKNYNSLRELYETIFVYYINNKSNNINWDILDMLEIDNYKVSDFFLFYRWYYLFFRDGKLLPLEHKIIYARTIAYKSNNKVPTHIFFDIYFRTNRYCDFSNILFVAEFNKNIDSEARYNITHSLFKQFEAQNHLTDTAKYHALIASNKWEVLSTKELNAFNNDENFMWLSNFNFGYKIIINNPKQIYALDICQKALYKQENSHNLL